MQYTITKKGRYGIINPIPEDILARTLNKYMTYTRQGSQWMANPLWAIVHLYSIKKGRFPWGFRNIVRGVFQKWIEKNPADACEFIEPTNTLDESLALIRKIQTAAVGLRYYQLDAIMQLINNGGGILCMPTGSGKSKTIIEYLKILNKKSIVIVPSLEIKRQWEEWTKITPNIHIYNFQNKHFKIEDYDVVVIDESHHTAAKVIYNLAMQSKTDTIVIGCSATPYREDGEDMRVHAALGPIVYQISRRELITKGYLADAKVTYINYNDFFEDAYKDYQTIYKEAIVNNNIRNNLIIQYACANELQPTVTLCLIEQIIHGEYLLNELRTRHPEKRVVFVNGGLPSDERKKIVNDILDRKYDIVIGTTIFDEGLDCKVFNKLILGGGGKSSIKVTQRIGRVLRLDDNKLHAIIYDFIDKPHYLFSHYKKRRKIL